MKIEITHYGIKYTIEYDHDDVEIGNLIEKIFNLIICAGYPDMSVANHFIATGEEFWDAK